MLVIIIIANMPLAGYSGLLGPDILMFGEQF
jgi:hypothetical protein